MVGGYTENLEKGPKEQLLDLHLFLRKQRSNYTSDDLWPDIYEIYLIIIPNEREFYDLWVARIVSQKVNCAQSYGWLSTKG